MKTLIALMLAIVAVGFVGAAEDSDYAVYCDTETNWIYVTSRNAPTNCPTSAAHTFRADSIRQIKPSRSAASDTFESEAQAQTNTIAALWSVIKALGKSLGKAVE